ncbi:hypothetical protein HanIR_Chr03g0127441 [Helianthus annuus]|nr:hypothetical protein HanIR_Chr03g0127441 [Helianthus annuus]
MTQLTNWNRPINLFYLFIIIFFFFILEYAITYMHYILKLSLNILELSTRIVPMVFQNFGFGPLPFKSTRIVSVVCTL